MTRKPLAGFILEALQEVNSTKKNGFKVKELEAKARGVVSAWQSSHARRDCGTASDVKLPEDEYDFFAAAEAESEPAMVVGEDVLD